MSSSQPTEASSMEPNTQPLAIADAPATDKQAGDVKTIDVGDGQSIKLDALGPIIVNSDGTLSRIPNWHEMSEIEKERTLRLVVKKRNQARLTKLREQDQEQS